jgi:tetratricopeptide (TPR) repeat protein
MKTPSSVMLLPQLSRALVAGFVLAGAASVLGQAAGSGPVGPAQGGILDSRAVKLSQVKNEGLLYFEGGKWAEAIKRFEEYLGILTEAEKQHESNKVTYLALGECYFRLEKDENYTKAIGYWNEFLRRWPTDPMASQVKSAVAQAHMKMKKWEEAVEGWAKIEEMAKAAEQWGMREHALSGQAFCWKQLKRPEDEIAVLERMVFPDFGTPTSAEGAVRLMSLYALKHDPADPQSVAFADKAVELLKKLQTKIHLVENLIALNSVAIKLGDELLDVHAYPKALDAYWTVRSRDVVAKMQKDRVAAIGLRMEQNLKGAGKDPIAYRRATRMNEEIQPILDESKRILGEFEKVPDFMPSLYFRMARCHADMNKKWEAIVVFNQILEEFPNSSVRELVVFSRLAMYADLGIAERTYAFADDYLKEFVGGPHAGEVGYIKGITAMRKKDWLTAEQNFEAALKILSGLPEEQKRLYWTEARYQLANARFLQNKFPDAMRDFTAFINEFGAVGGGKGAFMEDAEYQLALCHLFTGHYQKDPDQPNDADGAIERLQTYLKKWGDRSGYASDAKYRLAVCRFAAFESELAVKECEEWMNLYAGGEKETLQPEVLALMGDARAALKQHTEAADAYIQSYRHKNVSEEVLVYSLFEAGKQLQKAANWEKIEEIYTTFIREKPEHPQAVTCIYWMGKAKAKLGKMEEAKVLTVETLQKHLADPKREGCEMMLGQLAEWSKRRPQTTQVSATTDGVVAKWDAEAELDRLLKPLEENASPLAQYRLRYAKGELYRIGRQSEKRTAIIAEIAEQAKPEDLSPHLLMECGDLLMARGEVDRAEALYRKLKEDFRKSERVDAGWVGLGDVAFARKDFPKAMELYTYAIDRLGAPWKLKEALIGQAKCQVEAANVEASPDMAKVLYEKAKKTFEEVASVREWRGESTALALYSIADIQFRLKKFVEATAGWERITASQNKYPRWVARSYLRAADGYYRQGKNDEAQKKLRELFDPRDEKGEVDAKRLEKFKDLPEIDAARKKFAELGGTV